MVQRMKRITNAVRRTFLDFRRRSSFVVSMAILDVFFEMRIGGKVFVDTFDVRNVVSTTSTSTRIQKTLPLSTTSNLSSRYRNLWIRCDIKSLTDLIPKGAKVEMYCKRMKGTFKKNGRKNI